MTGATLANTRRLDKIFESEPVAVGCKSACLLDALGCLLVLR